MAQPSAYVYDYLVGIAVDAGTTYTYAQIAALSPTAKIVQMLTDNTKISISGTDSITFNKGDYAYISAGKTWTFNTKCEIALVNLVQVPL